MLKALGILITFVTAVGACGTIGPAAATADVVGLYVTSTEQGPVASQAFDELLFAKGDELEGLAGFRHGIAAFARVSAKDGVIGARIAFNTGRTDALIDDLILEAAELGLTVEPVREGDMWPDCADEPGCDSAGPLE